LKVLVTGGAGFIGSHLIDKLLEKGHEVVSLDCYSTGSKDNLRKHPKLEIVDRDLRMITHATLQTLVQEADLVYHLASVVGVALVDEIKDGGLHDNLWMAQKLYPLLEQYQKKLVFTSTSEVYGDKESWCMEEDVLLIGPPTKLRWAYACTKLIQEFMIHSYTFPFVITRLFNVTGPRQTWKHGMVLPKFIKAVKEGKNLTVYGDGEQTRCFCHINDCINVLYEAGVFKECDRQIINVGNNTEEISMKNLAERVIELSGKDVGIDLVPYERDFSKQHQDIYKRVPSTMKIERLLGYKPKYSLDDIIKDML